MRFRRQQGQVLISLIVAMLLIAVLGVGMYSLTTTATFTELLSNANDQAYHLARAGIRYALQKTHAANLAETTYRMPDANHLFKITTTNGVVTATGIVYPGSFMEASRVLVYTVPSGMPLVGDDINFSNDTPGFTSPITVNNNSALTFDSTTQTANLGGGEQHRRKLQCRRLLSQLRHPGRFRRHYFRRHLC
jgi:Tfp pilus assembly protein PilX